MKIIRTEEIRRVKFVKGITLISLAVTIVVLLILAGVSISAIVGDNGIIKKVQDSADLSKEAEAKEIMDRVVLEYNLSNNGETLEDFLQTKVPSKIDSVINNGDGTLTISKNGYTLDAKNKSSNSSGNNGGNSGSGNTGENDGTITITATPYKGVYDGISHEVFTSVSTVPSDAKIEYSTDGTNFSEVMPTITNASSATVTIRASKTGYKTKTTNMVATVEKAEGKLTLSETNGTSDKGNNLTFTASNNTGELSVESSDVNIAMPSINENTITVKPVGIGTTTITVTSASNVNYTEKTATYSVTVKNPIFIENSGVGYYADVDDDGTVDGIIFEDFNVGGSGQWGQDHINGGKYEYAKDVTSKNYYISKNNYDGPFGTRTVLTSRESGNDRFYVMGFVDYGPFSYYSAVASSKGDWKLPGRNDFVAFFGELNITSSKRTEYGLKNNYWTSTESTSDSRAYYIGASGVGITSEGSNYYARLAKKF